ncbi:MAG: DUF3883 domain-containing protein [Acidobacteria bacterium]|nr:DUF3883 domain-containing protein [Acidobacteriota bacterium]
MAHTGDSGDKDTPTASATVPPDSARRIREFRIRRSLTQTQLAQRLGVSFATVNRWENGQTRPSPLAWRKILALSGEPRVVGMQPRDSLGEPPCLDFTGRPAAVMAVAEGERLSFGHLANPAFATEISRIDALPHQRAAVYDHMLPHFPLRFLLADDAGAGKTIMTGLYLREMLARRLVRRILIVPPAGLVGNWQSEMAVLFNLRFEVVEGIDAKRLNPFAGEMGGRVIVSIDTLRSAHVFERLRESVVQPYDVVVFDEAHKLSASRGNDLRVRRTDRYKLAEALAGVPDVENQWRMPWTPPNFLLLTATPHMGKEYPYFALWRLLDPIALSTPEAFAEYPPERRFFHFIRRSKEEMVHLDGRPLYPTRISDTLAYRLSQGEVSEQSLYDETTSYLRFVYNKAKLLNRSAVRLAMSVFQRRLASSTFALLRSFERRISKLDALIEDVQAGRITMEQIFLLQRQIRDEDDVLESKTADEEDSLPDGREENEQSEEQLLQGVVAASLTDLVAEREQVVALRDLARRVFDRGVEAKFERLREVIESERFGNEKLIVFTEHRDTLEFLLRRLHGMGYTDQLAHIHGGMHYSERTEQVDRFRRSLSQGGARFLICTDAAGEGINLQFCWAMVNYDVPWNPARLEQRMGRIHRYGQKHDPVVILNLVAPETREGKVLQTLLHKLERIREALGSDKVYDVIGRLFQDVSIRRYMELVVTADDPDAVTAELGGVLTKEQVEALAARESSLYGDGGEVKRDLPRLRASMDYEIYRRLIPGYVRNYIETAAPLAGVAAEGDLGGFFGLRPLDQEAGAALLPLLDVYPRRLHDRMTVSRPVLAKDGIWVHPGEPLFERFRTLVNDRLGPEARRGAVFIDPEADRPYLFHLAIVSIVREADPQIPELATEQQRECRLVGVRQFEGTEVENCPFERVLLLRGGVGLTSEAQRLAISSALLREQAAAFITERIARPMAQGRREALLAELSQNETLVRRGFGFQEADLAEARSKQTERIHAGVKAAAAELDRIKKEQRALAGKRERAVAVLRREPDLVGIGPVRFIAHALVVPSSDPADRARHDGDVELLAMRIAREWEESEGATVIDVHTPDLARTARLTDYPGFDLLSIRPNGDRRGIEVKGRAGTGDIEILANEWAKACNMREAYWLYVIYDCATPAPRRVRVQDPFNRLLAKAKGSMLVGAKEVAEAAQPQVAEYPDAAGHRFGPG